MHIMHIAYYSLGYLHLLYKIFYNFHTIFCKRNDIQPERNKMSHFTEYGMRRLIDILF